MVRTSEDGPTKRDREAFESPFERRLTQNTQPSGERAAPVPAGPLTTGIPAVLDDLRSAAADFAARAEASLRAVRRSADTETRRSERLLTENARLHADVADRDSVLSQLVERYNKQKVREQEMRDELVKLAKEKEDLLAAARPPTIAVVPHGQAHRLLTTLEAAKRALAD